MPPITPRLPRSPRLTQLSWFGLLSLTAGCPFAPTGVVTSAGDTTDAALTTSTSDPTDTLPTTTASEGTAVTTASTGVATDSTGLTTDSTNDSTTGTDPGPAPCAGGDQLIHEDFPDLNFRCAVDRAIENIETPDCIFTCAAAQGITDLKAGGRAIADTTGIRHLVNLTTVDLPDNGIQVIADFHTLTKLTKLFLYDNEITSVAGLDAATDLQELYLYSNYIDSTADMPAFQKLTVLALGSNYLTSLDGLPILPTLDRLELGANLDLGSIGLETLETQTPALTKLYLNDIDLITLSDLPHLDSLEVLDLGNNGLGSLTNLYDFPKLRNLQLYQNSLTTLDELAGAPNALAVLDISDNMLTSEGLFDLSTQLWLDSEDLIYLAGNAFVCGPPFMDAVTNFSTVNVTLDPNPPTCN